MSFDLLPAGSWELLPLRLLLKCDWAYSGFLSPLGKCLYISTEWQRCAFRSTANDLTSSVATIPVRETQIQKILDTWHMNQSREIPSLLFFDLPNSCICNTVNHHEEYFENRLAGILGRSIHTQIICKYPLHRLSYSICHTYFEVLSLAFHSWTRPLHS